MGNAFRARPKQYLTKSQLRIFCNILYKKLEKCGYKYVVIAMADEDVDKLCGKDDHFERGISKIHCLRYVTKRYTKKCNAYLPKEVQHALKKTRKQFAKV